MALSAIDSAMKTIATYLATLDGISRAVRGWPERGTLNLGAGPVCTVTYVSHKSVWMPPVPLNDPVGPDNLVTYKVAELEILAQLDIWAGYRAQRDVAWETVEAGLHSEIPLVSCLWLNQVDYHNRPISVEADEGRSMDDQEEAQVGIFRSMYTLTIQTDQVVEATTPAQASYVLRTTVDGVTEPDLEIP